MLQFLLDHTDTTKAWTAYASYIRSLPLEVARKCYNILFERFPTTGIFVVQYCQLEEKAKNIQRVVDVGEQHACDLDIGEISPLLSIDSSLDVLL